VLPSFSVFFQWPLVPAPRDPGEVSCKNASSPMSSHGGLSIGLRFPSVLPHRNGTTLDLFGPVVLVISMASLALPLSFATAQSVFSDNRSTSAPQQEACCHPREPPVGKIGLLLITFHIVGKKVETIYLEKTVALFPQSLVQIFTRDGN